MAFYYTCRNCGANLDPGERCDCESAKVDRDFYRRRQIHRYGGGYGYQKKEEGSHDTDCP